MKNISIDIETFSDVNLAKCGVYKYAESPAFEILLFGYAVDGGKVQVVDLAQGESIPDEILDALTDESVTKWAFNASFERVCLSRYLIDLGMSLDPFHDHHPLSRECVRFLNPAGWKCSMVWSAYMGLPLSLEGVGTVLKLDSQKMKEGKDLIRYFCVPCKETKSNGGRTRNLPQHAPDKWALFKSYNERDVEVEIAIQERLKRYPVPAQVWDEYHLDQEINDRGIAIDLTLAENAIAIDAHSRDSLMAALKKKTGLENPNSVIQMIGWLEKHGMKTESLGKKQVQELLKTAEEPLRSVLLLWQKLAKSSVKKYQAMEMTACADSRARGMFQFYGASRTGRFAGRHIQLQNLPQNHLPDLSEARKLVRQGNYEALELLYDSIPDVLSQLIRTAFIPRKGLKFVVSDFSAIEARVLSWLAGETWRSDVFARNGDIYCASASSMFGVPVEKHGINGHLRQKGKIAELALGYGGSVGALKAMGAMDMGLSEDELYPLVQSWRSANPHIVDFWWQVDAAVKTAIKEHVPMRAGCIRFLYQSGMLFIQLPSGRRLSYVKPRIGENRFGGESVTYEGIGATRKWERLESYGPKFVENIVQGISRDILCYAMQTLRCSDIVGHVHDELIIECDRDVSVDAICEQMGRTPPWAEGLLLRADGYECEFYKKD
ncbi:DNA polymerase [Acidaminococcus provencensis]|uniref:DNA polymerase n=1 Tax=Acidaminococcus provencensis TaxID=2058289 RepID=UPI0022E8B0C4|nr:DNA polymerase [Acidaminococcus provencensis]